MAHLVCVTKDCECGYEEDEVIAGIRKKTAASGVRQGWFCCWGGASMRVVTW